MATKTLSGSVRQSFVSKLQIVIDAFSVRWTRKEKCQKHEWRRGDRNIAMKKKLYTFKTNHLFIVKIENYLKQFVNSLQLVYPPLTD